MSVAPGSVRDAIIDYLALLGSDASLSDIQDAVCQRLGVIPQSSIRSYLNLNVPGTFLRTGRGRYRLAATAEAITAPSACLPAFRIGHAELYHCDSFSWLASRPASTVHAVVTDPPYGLVEYSEKEQAKLRAGKGGIWRIPPSFDGHMRAPLPRFTVLGQEDLQALHFFFKRLALLLCRVVVPGGNVIVASNPLLAHIVASAMIDGGLELRGILARLTMTMRGGDRPKNAHLEFDDVSVMPRSMWEPWVVMRRPLEGRVQDNLRRWKTGGFRRISSEKPFGDVIQSRPTSKIERAIAPHPSLKPQDFLRQLVRAVLPLGEGTILDPFAGSGSTLAAANALDLNSIGVEIDSTFISLAETAIPKLAAIQPINPALPKLSDTGTVKRCRTRTKLSTIVAPEIGDLYAR